MDAKRKEADENVDCNKENIQIDDQPKVDIKDTTEVTSVVSQTDSLQDNTEPDNTEKTNEEENTSETDSVDDLKEKEIDEENMTLYEACKLGNYNLVQKMLEKSTEDVNKQDDEGWSCLHETCVHTCQFTNIAELLLQHGADPNIQDNSGETPLHGSVLFHYIDNIKLLMKYKADPTLCNLEGVSPQLIAERSHDDDMSKLLGLTVKKKKTPNRRKSQLKKVPKKSNGLPYTPSPLSSPSILKKRKRDKESENELMSSPKKRITFSSEVD